MKNISDYLNQYLKIDSSTPNQDKTNNDREEGYEKLMKAVRETMADDPPWKGDFTLIVFHDGNSVIHSNATLEEMEIGWLDFFSLYLTCIIDKVGIPREIAIAKIMSMLMEVYRDFRDPSEEDYDEEDLEEDDDSDDTD
jgi:hypothetical protein